MLGERLQSLPKFDMVDPAAAEIDPREVDLMVAGPVDRGAIEAMYSPVNRQQDRPLFPSVVKVRVCFGMQPSSPIHHEFENQLILPESLWGRDRDSPLP
jgi:hypothetical protein